MPLYRCNVCNTFEYEPDRGSSTTGIKPGTDPGQFPDDWNCPICGADRTHLKQVPEEPGPGLIDRAYICRVCGSENPGAGAGIHEQISPAYQEEWARKTDPLEVYMEDIHTMAVTGESIIEPMRTRKPTISWDDILIMGAQIAKIPVGTDQEVMTRTVIGPAAKVPLVIETPVFITHMSFGALSREVKIALSKGSAGVKTAMCSGEGGILPESREHAYKYIFII